MNKDTWFKCIFIANIFFNLRICHEELKRKKIHFNKNCLQYVIFTKKKSKISTYHSDKIWTTSVTEGMWYEDLEGFCCWSPIWQYNILENKNNFRKKNVPNISIGPIDLLSTSSSYGNLTIRFFFLLLQISIFFLKFYRFNLWHLLPGSWLIWIYKIEMFERKKNAVRQKEKTNYTMNNILLCMLFNREISLSSN